MTAADPVLVADIGGANARFAIAEIEDGAVVIRDKHNFRVEDFKTVRDAAGAYLETISERPRRACFAAAGPVIDGEIDFTNSRWVLRVGDFIGSLGFDEFEIVNDFYALAAGIAHLPDDAFALVKPGTPLKDAPQLVFGPGTGLGQALIVPTDSRLKIVATEGGHVAFAPYTDEEREIRKFITREQGRVSLERVLSGRGLVNIHRALCAIEGAQPASLEASEITQAARAGEDPIAARAVHLFFAILGRAAGDAVLATGARGGVVLGGGILPKIRDMFLKSAFVEHFLDKGRMSDYVGATPVKLIVAGGAALYGAAAVLGSKE